METQTGEKRQKKEEGDLIEIGTKRGETEGKKDGEIRGQGEEKEERI